ncbi:serine/threonine-protein kinase Nek8-like, partial [Dysidea avara]|uniref:serine/threonine-protein kinase Nek8-like n=1 Tax=Dysidea avara TaxID=196820 RepID=UPI003326C84A
MNQSSDGTDSEGVSMVEDPSKELTDLGPSPPLAILSSRAKSASSLVKIANPGVAVVYYKYESATLDELLKSVRKKLNGRRALSIALLFHGHPGFFKIIRDKSVNLESLREDKEIQRFFLTLVKSHLDTSGTLSRIDLLSCPVAQNNEGKTLIDELGQLLKIPIYTSGDVLGGNVTTVQGSPRSSMPPKIGALYFDEEKLKELVEQTPQNLALYEKLRVVGKGAFGAAVLYKKKDDESFVIIKEINMLDLKKTERALAMNEVQVLSIMDHPNIISLYDSFEESGVLMIEMEYADGGTLAQYLNKQEKSLSEPDILNFFKQMVDALRFLHDHRILHRDLKTSNVFLTKEGLIKLGDFGISKVLSATRQEANTVLGTAHYISPEICEGKPYNIKSDVWALGCILHEMACLQKTFDGSNIHAVVNKIVKVIFPPVKGDYTDELKDLIQSMLQKEPDNRPTAEEIQVIRLPQLLERYIQEEGEEDTTAATHAKSFLYQLEYSKLCLIPVGLPIKERVEQVSLGFSHVLILTMDHFVYSYGEGGRGQLGHGDAVSHHSPKLIESLKEIAVFRVDCGAEFSVFSSCNGLLMTCGRGDMGGLGQGDWKDQHKPQLVQGLLNYDVLVVGCGENHVIVLMTDGSIFAWGLGCDGRLGLGNEDNQCSPQMVEVAVRVKDVKCGLDGSMFLTSTGTLLACGSNRFNKLGLNQRTTFRMQVKSLWNKTRLEVSCQLKPSPVRGLTKYKVVDMSLGPTHSAVIVEGGKVVTFGRNSEGQLGCGSMNCKSTPGMVSPVDKGRIMHVACGEVSTIVATEDNFLLFWGSRPLLQSSISNPTNVTDADPLDHPSATTMRKRYSSVSHTNRPSSSSRNLRNSTSLPDDNLVGDTLGTTPFLLKCRSTNDSNRTLVSEGSCYSHCLVESLEATDAKKAAPLAAPNIDMNTENAEWKKVYLTPQEIEFCTENGEIVGLAASDSSN